MNELDAVMGLLFFDRRAVVFVVVDGSIDLHDSYSENSSSSTDTLWNDDDDEEEEEKEEEHDASMPVLDWQKDWRCNEFILCSVSTILLLMLCWLWLFFIDVKVVRSASSKSSQIVFG